MYEQRLPSNPPDSARDLDAAISDFERRASRYLDGQLTPPETRAFELELETAAPAERSLFDEMRAIDLAAQEYLPVELGWNRGPRPHARADADADADARDALDRRADRVLLLARSAERTRRRRWLAAAAVLLLGVGLSFWWSGMGPAAPDTGGVEPRLAAEGVETPELRVGDIVPDDLEERLFRDHVVPVNHPALAPQRRGAVRGQGKIFRVVDKKTGELYFLEFEQSRVEVQPVRLDL